ncbi:MAG: hypothetical protein Q7V61_03795 [Actinomycetota bacterium]|nr:hypothetical protein [Actinomycetota bacterium]
MDEDIRNGNAFGGIPEASRARRLAAATVDAITTVGGPWGVLALAAPLMLPFIELVIVAVPLALVVTAAWVAARRARTHPNGDRISLGQLATGLTVLRTQDAFRVVRSADVAPELRPAPARVATGTVAACVMAIVAVVLLSGVSWIAVNVIFQEQISAANEREWQAHEAEARKVCDALLTALLSSDPKAGTDLVADAAVETLPQQKKRIRSEGVTAFRQEGSGGGGSEYEYMFQEVNPATAGDPNQHSLSILLKQRGDGFVVTQIGTSDSYTAPEGAGLDSTESAAP